MSDWLTPETSQECVPCRSQLGPPAQSSRFLPLWRRHPGTKRANRQTGSERQLDTCCMSSTLTNYPPKVKNKRKKKPLSMSWICTRRLQHQFQQIRYLYDYWQPWLDVSCMLTQHKLLSSFPCQQAKWLQSKDQKITQYQHQTKQHLSPFQLSIRFHTYAGSHFPATQSAFSFGHRSDSVGGLNWRVWGITKVEPWTVWNPRQI